MDSKLRETMECASFLLTQARMEASNEDMPGVLLHLRTAQVSLESALACWSELERRENNRIENHK